MTQPALLTVSDLRTYFYTGAGVARAVDGVSFTIGAGETLGIVGESGCGKSVTALSILRLVQQPGRIEPGSRIMFENQDLLQLDDAGIRRVRGNRIAMIFQEPMTALNPVFTVGDQIAEVARVHASASRRAAWDRAVEMLTMVGIPAPAERASQYPHQLSGGMRQRVLIAMALIMNPALVIADEPTTALDVTIQAQILELLADLQQRLGTSIAMITHDLGVIAEVASRVVVMYGGEVVEEARVETLFTEPHHPYTEGLLQRDAEGRAPAGAPRGDSGQRSAAYGVADGVPLSRSVRVRVGPVRARASTALPDRRWPRVAMPPGRRARAATNRSRDGTVVTGGPDGRARRRQHDGRVARTSRRTRPQARPLALRRAYRCSRFRSSRSTSRFAGALFGRAAGAVRAVDGVSLQVARGETLGIVGESGCGKTTLGRCILRLIEPTSGQIHFDGIDVRALDPDLDAPAPPSHADHFPGPVFEPQPAHDGRRHRAGRAHDPQARRRGRGRQAR